MTKFADLHIHTNYSDSTLSASEVVDESIKNGLSCIAITDHDTVEGIGFVKKAALGKNLEVIPGIELSSEYSNQEIHILGYLVDCESDSFLQKLIKMQEVRVKRIKLILDKLKQVGIDHIEPEEICALSKSNSVGRPHVAAILQQKGWVSDAKQAFEKYLAEGACAYVEKYQQTPYEAIKFIRDAGGVAVLAHPMITQRDELIPSFVEAGLQGIEVYYPNYSPSVIDYYANIAKKHNLLLTGGSDAHGEAKTNTFIGRIKIPYELVEKLKALKE
ncbi:MAG: PHP domain-containing protein [Candidatus Omnitrophica bacterium]|nr:PHP domain-containing protein [Candidatus Omnitrophota bacterium]